MTTTDLLATLHALQAEKYPALDSELVADVIAAQSGFMGNPNEAYKRISQAVEACLKRKEGT